MQVLMIKFERGRNWLCVPYAGSENPKAGDTAKHCTGQVGTVFELDLQADKTAKYDSLEDEKIKVKFDDRISTIALASEFRFVKRASE
jgi:hypothetical protein